MESILQSFLLVFASEMGDKTQLLAFILATKFKQPWAIMAGIGVAAILNHGIASALGGATSHLIPQEYLKWIIASVFFGFAYWTLHAGEEDDEDEAQTYKHGAFLTTLIAFFIGEMGDKTQLSAVALGAKFQNPVLVTIGTTLAMLAASFIPVFFGNQLTQKVPLSFIKKIAALLFFVFGALVLL